ncbi:dehydrogenase [Microbacterium sp. BH-3-3-3]|nr:dehydrogenase [Microbacterium sp. BH-3-3-3]
MGRVHAQAWSSAPRFFDIGAPVSLEAVCGRDAEATGTFARRFGIPRTFGDWREAVADPDITVIDICTPGSSHAEIALAALAAGKHVLCEKPLANTLQDAAQMRDAAASAALDGIRSMVGFSYRRTPALAYARELVRNGRLGQIRHIRARYLQDWIVDPEFPLVWRLQADAAGSGALGDIGAHIIDLATFVTGHRLVGVSALTETFVRTRPLAAESAGLTADRSEKNAARGPVTVDDSTVFIGRTDGGALASFEATRLAPGSKNAMRLEIDGSLGSLSFDFESLNELLFHDHTLPAAENGFRRILVTEPDHPYAGAWWPAGHGLGYDHLFVHQAADFARAIAEGIDPEPSFTDGFEVQRVLDAVQNSAADSAAWTQI